VPCRNLKLRAQTDRRYIRSTYRSNRFILAEVTAPHMHADENANRQRPPVNLAFVLDRSGSMSGEKIYLAKQAVTQAIGRLKAEDRFAVVVYDDQIDVVIRSTRATAEAKQDAMRLLGAIDARNQTNLGEGWLRGAEQVARELLPEGVNRVLLLTDGLANVGITDRDELANHAAELRKRGVETTTFGLGADFDEVLLQEMSTAGGGNFYYITDARQINDFITSEVGEALDVVARDVRLDITAPHGVRVESLSPFAFEQVRKDRTVVSLGSLVAEQVVQVVLRLNFPLGEMGDETGVVLSLSGDDAESEPLSWEYADGRTNDEQERNAEVDRAVASVFAARARQEATALNRAGNYSGAQAALVGVAKRIRSYAGRDTVMRALVGELENDAQNLAIPVAPAALKEMHFRSYAASRSRMPDGKAFRRPQS